MWSLLKLNNVDFHNQNKTKQKRFKSVKRQKMPQSWPELCEQSKTLWNGNRKWFIFQWKSSIGKSIAEIVHANAADSDRVGSGRNCLKCVHRCVWHSSAKVTTARSDEHHRSMVISYVQLPICRLNKEITCIFNKR